MSDWMSPLENMGDEAYDVELPDIWTNLHRLAANLHRPPHDFDTLVYVWNEESGQVVAETYLHTARVQVLRALVPHLLDGGYGGVTTPVWGVACVHTATTDAGDAVTVADVVGNPDRMPFRKARVVINDEQVAITDMSEVEDFPLWNPTAG